MVFTQTPDQPETRTEFTMQLIGAIPDNFEATATEWAFGTKGCNNNMSSGLERMACRLDVIATILGIGQEMENGPIMPYVVEKIR